MNQKTITFLLVLLCLYTRAFAQFPVCTSPPNCIINGQLDVTDTIGNMDTSTSSTINGWYVSHGSPSIFPDNAPGNTGHSVWMWSCDADGEGMFTCYKFQKNKSYNVCIWVKNTNSTTDGNLEVYACKGLSSNPPGPSTFGSPVPSVSPKQLISNSYTWSPVWKHVNYYFTANDDYTQLWIYPFKGSMYSYTQYEVQVDDIRVTPDTNIYNNVYISATKDSITDCSDSTTLTVVGAPAGATLVWSPTTGLSSYTGSSVVAKPCSSTTYSVTMMGPDTACAFCYRLASKTVTVVNNVSQSNISNNGPVPCGKTLKLAYGPLDSCGASYTWLNPSGDTVSHTSVYIKTHTSVLDTGTYTLVIKYPNGCIYYLTTYVNIVGCPCQLHVAFGYFSGESCNPIFFINNSTHYGNIVYLKWNFGDGTSSSSYYASHTYTTPGTYTVCLHMIVISGSTVCDDSVCHTFTVCNHATTCHANSDFSYTTLASPAHTVQFTDLSSGTGVICDWHWDFGDGTTSSLQSPVHTFPMQWGYWVCLTITICEYDSVGNLIDTCKSIKCVDFSAPGPFINAGIKNNTDVPKANVLIIPNPATDNIAIKVDGFTASYITITDIQGRLIGNATLTGKNTYSFNVQGLPPGVYTVVARSGDMVKKVRFVKN